MAFHCDEKRVGRPSNEAIRKAEKKKRLEWILCREIVIGWEMRRQKWKEVSSRFVFLSYSSLLLWISLFCIFLSARLKERVFSLSYRRSFERSLEEEKKKRKKKSPSPSNEKNDSFETLTLLKLELCIIHSYLCCYNFYFRWFTKGACVIEIKTFFFNDSIDRYLIIAPLDKSVDSFYLDCIKYFFFCSFLLSKI